MAWISISDKLPGSNSQVLIIRSSASTVISFGSFVWGKGAWLDNLGKQITDVTYWMSMPSLP